MKIENLLSDLIQIPSVNPPGGETEVARYLKRLFDEHQIPNEIIESGPGRGNFFAYLGEGEKSLLYLAHIDVVAVSEDWDFAPFSGEIKDGFVHGRGALDCKGLAAAEAWAMLNLARSGKLGGRLIFAATADEEAGGVQGMKYLADNYKDKLMADFCINEGSWQAMEIGGKICHFIQIGEKGVCWSKMKTKGVSAHGSLPMLGDNAVVKMAEAIKGLADYQPRVTLISEVEHLVRAIASLEGFGEEINENNISELIQEQGDEIFAGVLSAATRMTVSTNAVKGGAKVNIIPDSCEADVDIRVLPGQDEEYVIRELAPIIGDAQMETLLYQAPTFSPTDSEYYRLILGTLQGFVGDGVILPCISSGSTDSKYLRGLGIPCYGIDMVTMNLDADMKRSVHGRNEKVDIASLQLKSDFLTELARKYLGEQVRI